MLRQSLFTDLVNEVKDNIADVTGQEKYNPQYIMKEIKRCLGDLPLVYGLSNNTRVSFLFEPISMTDVLLYNKDVYENASNIEVNYYLKLSNIALPGHIECKAWTINSMSLALLTLRWNQTGTIKPPTIDISLDKDVTSGDYLSGTWLVSGARIDPIVSDKEIDLTAFPSSSFSIRWNFEATSDYKIHDTMADIVLIDRARLMEHKENIVYTCASNIYSKEAAIEAKNGAIQYAEFLSKQSELLLARAKGSRGGGKSVSVYADSMDSGYDRDTRSNKVFGRKLEAGDWVEIVGNTVIGRRIRRIY